MGHVIDFESFYRVLQDISASLHSGSGVKDVLETVVKRSAEALNANGAILRLLNLETHEMDIVASYGISERYLSKGPVLIEKTVTDLCRQNKTIIIRDILNDPRLQYPKEAWAEGIRMMIDTPLTLGNDILGILRIFLAEPREFTEEELNFLILIAERGSAVIQRAKLIETQQYRYDQLALQTEKLSALGRMAAGIAHEINNPLAGILLYSTNMLKKVPEEGPIKEGLEIIIGETLRCKTIIQDLLEFSREREPVTVLANINHVIGKAVQLLANEFRLYHIGLEMDLSKQMPEIPIDENQMEQIFVNLLLNAIQAIEEKGTITIRSSISLDRKNINVEISDTGCGIPPEHMNKIFEPFFSTKVKGTGLGLAVTYGILRKHGGNIYASSEYGKGARFTIELPILSQVPSTKIGRRNENH